MSQPSWIGYKLNNRYEIEQELGAGGMSSVYKANDPNLKRVVAIKLIHPHLSSNPDFVRRFEMEASSVAQLRHSNIVQVYDFNHDGDTYYMVLEFVPGETLQSRLKRLNQSGRKFSLEEFVDLATKICGAVDYAHKRGLVHRDIKPANVMINVQNEPILMDFGIVKILGGTQHTATGAVVGTALYMSPEQIRGEHADHRADIYSLGVMLYEMVSGKPPFEADSAMTIMMKHLHDPVPDLADMASSRLKDILNRALAKNPDDRYSSAGELAADLQSLLRAPAQSPVDTGGTTIVDPPPSAKTDKIVQQPAARQAKPSSPARPQAAGSDGSGGAGKSRNKFLLLGGGAGLLAVIACVVLGAIFLPRLLNASTDATPTLESALVVETDTPEPTQVTPTKTSTPVPSTATATATSTQTATPSITPTPTETQPVGPYVSIFDIINEGGVFKVHYKVYNFDPIISSTPGTNHIHFYWNVYTPEQVGIAGLGDSTGGGAWRLYDLPSPFSQFTSGNRPANATQICALVANHDHSINFDTGNCFDIP